MLVLDTDYLSLLQWSAHIGRDQVLARIRLTHAEEVATTIVTYEEQTRGWIAVKASAKTVVQEIAAYSRLKRHLDDFREVPVLDFDSRAGVEYQRLRQLRIRVGTMDLKIAAIVLADDATLLTKNLADFRKVPRLKIEDWTGTGEN
jgi:tRNA(fMet)-specific endonuclease VapC